MGSGSCVYIINYMYIGTAIDDKLVLGGLGILCRINNIFQRVGSIL